MKKVIYIAIILILAVSCSEPFEIKKESSSTRYLAINAILTDVPSYQTVTLSESIEYNSEEEVKPVTDATVTISSADSVVEFIADPSNPGLYTSPTLFCGEPGGTYTLRVERTDNRGEIHIYEATSTMIPFGFDVKAIDYKYTNSLVDSLWTIGIWGTDGPAPDQYLVIPGLNGYYYPMESTLPLEDHYFTGGSVSGFPISVFSQSVEKMKTLGPCAKPFETGDEVTLMVYDLSLDFYRFMFALVESSTSISIPIISSQPANLPCNFSGENVVGYFGAAPMRILRCTVDDPYRQDYKFQDAEQQTSLQQRQQ